jgi:hypothetical protein
LQDIIHAHERSLLGDSIPTIDDALPVDVIRSLNVETKLSHEAELRAIYVALQTENEKIEKDLAKSDLRAEEIKRSVNEKLRLFQLANETLTSLMQSQS